VSDIVKKRILFVSPLPPPHYGSALSSEMSLDILNNENSFEVRSIKLNYSREMSDVGKLTPGKIGGIFNVAGRIKKELRTFKPDLVYFMPAVSGFGLLRDYYLLKIVKRLNHGKLILHLRAPIKDNDWTNPVRSLFIKGLLICDKIILLGSELIPNLNSAVPEKDIYLLPNALVSSITEGDAESIYRSRGNGNYLNLLFLSNLHESKGWFKLLESCRLLNDADIKYLCHFVGDWPSTNEKLKFFRYVEKNNLYDNVVYHGRLLGREKQNMLREADILIFPTEYEAFGRVIIEAMEFGLPVIASNAGTIPSIIDNGITGFVLENNNANEIFQCILKLQDKTLRTEMGRKGREKFINEFTIGIYKDRFVKIFKEN
jgi:glycosyltransferase involved in cell wall biosynthesis